MHALYEAGYSLEHVGTVFGLTPPAVSQRFKRAGLPTRDPRAPSNGRRARADRGRARAEQMYRMYQRGLSSNEVAEAFGVSQPRITQIFQHHGFEMRDGSEAQRLRWSR
jgi:predicted transcriptional regulator